MKIIKTITAVIFIGLTSYLPVQASPSLAELAGTQWANDYTFEYKQFNSRTLESHTESLQVFVNEQALDENHETLGWLIYTQDTIAKQKRKYAQAVIYKALPLEPEHLANLLFTMPEQAPETLTPIAYRSLKQCNTPEMRLSMFGHTQVLLDMCNQQTKLPSASQSVRQVVNHLEQLLEEVKTQGISLQ